MPGLPSTVSEIEAPTGGTKQITRVACSCTPAAELMRPAGMKPSSCACRKRASQKARRSAASGWARALATRRRTSPMLVSSPLAYFSSSVSREMTCSGAATWISMRFIYLTAARVLDKLPVWKPPKVDFLSRLLRPGLRGAGAPRRGGLGGRLAGLARALEQIRHLAVREAQRQLDRGVAFLGGLRRVGAV